MLPIGITCGIQERLRQMRLPWDYIRAIERAGGLPIPLMFFQKENAKRFMGLIRGLILSGGGDVDPCHFGEEPRPGCGGISPQRDENELELARLALETGMPILGICRGAQVLNIALGGDIFQDLGMKEGELLEHYQKAPDYYPYHSLTVGSETRLGKTLVAQQPHLQACPQPHLQACPQPHVKTKAEAGTKSETRTAHHVLRVNSFHHQAIRKLGKGLIISAIAADGVIEAVESIRHPFALGVQWHPETLAKKNLPGGQEIFDALLQAAAQPH